MLSKAQNPLTDITDILVDAKDYDQHIATLHGYVNALCSACRTYSLKSSYTSKA